jgi:3-oxoacyl-[acyl-carrier-protein] synthase-3
MAISVIHNVALTGLSSCVPKQVDSNESCELFSPEERLKLLKTTGIHRRRISGPSQCTSDLCHAAANHLFEESGVSKSEVDVLVFVTQYTDYPLPSTSAILQHRLGLPKTCLTIDIVLGCSGYVYGLSVISSILSAMRLKRGLLLVGDTASKVVSPKDRSVYPLFGDAGLGHC